MIDALADIEIVRMRFYTRSAEHIYKKRFDRSRVECAQVVFHKTYSDGSIWSRTQHVVKVEDYGNSSKWQAGNTGLHKVYFYINTNQLTPKYLGWEIIDPPPPPAPEPKKKRRRRRRKNNKPQNQVVV